MSNNPCSTAHRHQIEACARQFPDYAAFAHGLAYVLDHASASTLKNAGLDSTRIDSPVLMVAGGAASMKPEEMIHVTALLKEALAGFGGTVICGGTTAGVPGCIGEATVYLANASIKKFRLLGYIPKSLPKDAVKDNRYDKLIMSDTTRFSPVQVLHAWQDVLASGIKPEDVRLLGFGGGKIAAFEYRLALSLGATVGVVMGSGVAVDELLEDVLWCTPRGLHLVRLPADPKSLFAFVV